MNNKNNAKALIWVLQSECDISLERLPGLEPADARGEANDLIGLCDLALSLGAPEESIRPIMRELVRARDLVAPLDIKIGTRLKAIHDLDIFPLKIWPPGTTGQIVNIDYPDQDCVLYSVRLDQHDPLLNEWDNCLQVGADGTDHYALHLGQFEILPDSPLVPYEIVVALCDACFAEAMEQWSGYAGQRHVDALNAAQKQSDELLVAFGYGYTID